MNANFGLLPPLEYKAHKRERKKLLVERALKAIEDWKKGLEI